MNVNDRTRFSPAWPEIPYPQWRETAEALHLFLQVIGKYRLAHTPWLNHSWHATLYISARGLTTSLVHDGTRAIEVRFDLLTHEVVASSSDGSTERFPLGEMSVADFYRKAGEILAAVGGRFKIRPVPNEVAEPIPFPEDHRPRPYDAAAVERFFKALVAIDAVLKQFRTGFIGKSSPVHLFWGSFDLAVTRFSGRRAPLHPGGIPALPDEITREAYSHEVSSAGFWPGGGPVDYPAFYSYAYPEPAGFKDARIRPEGSFYHPEAREFLLPYDLVRRSADPPATLLEFLQATYEAAADLGAWDRAALDARLGKPRQPRLVTRVLSATG